MDKRGFFTGLIGILVLLVVGFFWFVGQVDDGVDDGVVEECVKVQTGCCPCSMGGGEKCVLESEVGEYEEVLLGCEEGLICAAVYSCEIESCEYVDGECVAV